MKTESAADRLGTFLTLLTLVGMAVALIDAFAVTLPPPIALIALWVVFLAGGLPHWKVRFC